MVSHDSDSSAAGRASVVLDRVEGVEALHHPAGRDRGQLLMHERHLLLELGASEFLDVDQ